MSFRFQPDMIKILYVPEPPNGEVFEYNCYANKHDRKWAYEYLLDQGYEIIGEA